MDAHAAAEDRERLRREHEAAIENLARDEERRMRRAHFATSGGGAVLAPLDFSVGDSMAARARLHVLSVAKAKAMAAKTKTTMQENTPPIFRNAEPW